jgi:splicing factor 3B subunit 2
MRNVADKSVKRKAGGVDVSIDASELEGLSEDELKRRYEAHSRGTAGVPGAGGREDFSDIIAKEMAKKKQKMDRERDRDRDRDRDREGGGKKFKF